MVRAVAIAACVGLVVARSRHAGRRDTDMSTIRVAGVSDMARAIRAVKRADVVRMAQDTTDDDNDSADDADDDNDKPSTPSHVRGGVRTLTLGRQLRAARDTAALMHVTVEYGVGTLNIAPADAPWLYNVRLAHLDRDKGQSVRYDTATRTLSIGGESGSSGMKIGKHNNSDDSNLHIGLARGVPLTMKIEFGAGDADIRLGGLSIRDLAISTGASDATVRFDAPNPVVLDRLRLEVGAAGFKAVGLGNAHIQTLLVEAGAGDVDLDFGGHWTGDISLDLTAALGAVHIHVPRGVVVDQLSGKVVLGSTDDNTGGSAGAGPPQTPGGPIYHLRYRGTTTLGAIEFDRQVAN
jgi:hypothetical protein